MTGSSGRYRGIAGRDREEKGKGISGREERLYPEYKRARGVDSACELSRVHSREKDENAVGRIPRIRGHVLNIKRNPDAMHRDL